MILKEIYSNILYSFKKLIEFKLRNRYNIILSLNQLHIASISTCYIKIK